MKSKQQWRYYLWAISSLFLIGGLIGSTSVHAEEKPEGFSVKAILPENQHNKQVTYYDLRVEPGQKQTLELDLYNSSSEEQELSVKINPAITNDNGVIDYSTQSKKYTYDDSLKVPITSIAKTQEKVKVPAKGKATAKIQLDVPEEPFDGLVLGGIYITSLEKEDEKEESKKGGGMQIKNKVAYTVGLTLTEKDPEIKADLQYVKTLAAQEAGRNIVKTKLRNVEAINLDDIDYHAQVMKKGSDEVLHERAVSGYRMAPNSYFHYQIPWDNQPFRSGTYRLKMTAESKTTGQKWAWDEEFTITADEAKKLNEKAVDLEKDNTWMYWAIGGGLLGLLLLLILWVIIHKKRKAKKHREQLARRKKQQGKKKKPTPQTKRKNKE